MTENGFKQFVLRLKEEFGEKSVDVLDFEGMRSIYLRGSKFDPPNRNSAILALHFTSHSENIDGQLYTVSLALPLLVILNEFQIELERNHIPVHEPARRKSDVPQRNILH